MIMSHLSITRLVHLASGEHVKLATKMAYRDYQVELPNASDCAVKNFCFKLWKEHFSPPKSAVKRLAQKIDSASNMSSELFWWLMKQDNFLIYEVPSSTLNNNVLDRYVFRYWDFC